MGFALAPSQFGKRLSQFLQGAGLGYERGEIQQWIELRNPATHAKDFKRSPIITESDVRPVISRIEQAAYDVLLNKELWHDASTGRRRVWRPTVATISPSHDIAITRGHEASFQINVRDPFGIFDMDLSSRLRNLADQYWSIWSDKSPILSGAMVVQDHSA